MHRTVRSKSPVRSARLPLLDPDHLRGGLRLVARTSSIERSASSRPTNTPRSTPSAKSGEAVGGTARIPRPAAGCVRGSRGQGSAFVIPIARRRSSRVCPYSLSGEGDVRRTSDRCSSGLLPTRRRVAPRECTAERCGLPSLRPDGELGFDGSVRGPAEPDSATPDAGEASTPWDHHPRHTVVGAVGTSMGAPAAPASHPPSRDPRELRRQYDGRPRFALARSDLAVGLVHERLRVLRLTRPD